MAALRIDSDTLLVHHVIIFKQTFTDTEVVFFYFLLSTLDGIGNHLVFNHFTFLESKSVHDTGNTV